jgi:hypothetical protein
MGALVVQAVCALLGPRVYDPLTLFEISIVLYSQTTEKPSSH